MDARLVRAAFAAAALASMGASYRTPNFVVTAPTPEIAQQVAKAAEKYRHDLAVEWLGEALPTWAQPCPVTLQIGDHLGAGGATSFIFDHGEVFGWQMNIQGPLARILDSVLPHEITHTVFATHFRRPLPRWADEGACTTVEHTSEKAKHQKMLITFLRTGRGIPFSQMFAMKEYPQDILPLYAQGHSLSTFLLSQGGKQKYLQFVADGLDSDQWVEATRRHYGFQDLAQLQDTWLDWVRRGSPPIQQPADDRLRPRTEAVSSIYRAQSADHVPARTASTWRSATSPAPRSPAANTLAANDRGPAPAAAPKPDQHDRRVLVEWDSRHDTTPPAAPPAPGGAAPPPRSVYDARPTNSGTVLR